MTRPERRVKGSDRAEAGPHGTVDDEFVADQLNL